MVKLQQYNINKNRTTKIAECKSSRPNYVYGPFTYWQPM